MAEVQGAGWVQALQESVRVVIEDFRDPGAFLQFFAIAIAVFAAWSVWKLAVPKIHRLWVTDSTRGFVAGLRRFLLHILENITFSATAALSLYVLTTLINGFGLAHGAGLMIARVAYSVFFAWAILRISLPLLQEIIGRKYFGDGLKKVVCVIFWILAVLQIINVLPIIVSWTDEVQLSVSGSGLSLLELIKALVIVLVVTAFANRLADLLESRIMASEMEVNLRVVFSRLCRILLLVSAVLASLSAVGIDLTVLSVFTGALGVGIGFGLQKIASSYISGFIILLDRSVKLGDLVDVGGCSGVVTRINTRYSVIRNLMGEEFTVPNEVFVTSTVKNCSLTDPACAITMDACCSYESDVTRALEIFIECVKAQPRVLRDREPWAVVTEFADSCISLRAGFWVSDPQVGTGGLKSAIFRDILRRFNEEGIEIPYKKLDVTFLNGIRVSRE